MNRSRIPSPARSLGVISTPRKHTPRRSRSVCSAKSNGSVRLTKVIPDSFHLSPMPNRRSVLNDNTDIEIPGHKSWWKKLGENPIDMKDLLANKEIAEVNNVAEEFDVEILSQEKKNYSLDLPESSDGESINSIVMPQRKLFTQKENQAQKKFEHIIDNRETLAILQKSQFDQEKDIDVGPKNLFNKAPKPRTKPAFPAALLNISSKSVNKTKEMPAPEVEGQVRNLFGNRPGTKRKNFFADFIVSESEDEIPDIQPKVFGFQKNAQKRRESSASRCVGHSPTSSIDLELDDWKHLPSSTMVENQLEEATTPVKRARLSKLSEAKETETINTNRTVNKTRQSNESATSKNKSKASTYKLKDKKDEEFLSASKTKEDLLKSKNNLSLNTSSNVRMTRNKSKSMIESPLKVGEHTKLQNTSKNKSKSHLNTPIEVQEGDKNTENNEINMKTGLNQQDVEKQIKNVSTAVVPEEDDEDFTLEYDNDDEQVNEPLAADNIENKSNESINLVDEERNKIKDKDELDDAHFEKQKDDNKQQYFKTSLIKDFDKQNKSSVTAKDINRSQSRGKQKQSLSDSQNNSRKSQNVTLDKDHQKTKNESRLEKDKIDTNKETVTNNIENIDEGENVHESTQRNDSTKANDENNSQNETEEADQENEQQNESQQLGNENEEQNESTQSNDENEIRNKSKESEAKSKERNESTQSGHEREQQNDSSQSNNDIQNESIHSDVENESEHEQEDNHEDIDETVIKAEKEETENEQDESKNEQETEELVEQDESEAEQETEEQIQQNDSENINSDNQEQNDSESNHNETEEQQNEAMEVEDGKEHESDVEEQNDTENQENENYDSDDNLQNESNLSENDEQEEQFELDQEQSEDVPENEVTETSNHDATLRNKKKAPTIIATSPEAILNDKTNQMESFMAKGRNTSIRKTKSVIKNLTIKPSLAPMRESIVSSDGTRDSSAEGSGWDSHRTTRKTLRLTFGKDFTPRKSLRALVMEKSAKRHTNINEITTKIPQANSTELPAFDSYEDAAETNEIVEEPSDHELSARTRQTTLENFLQKIKQENLERRREMEEKVRASLKAPTGDIFNPFKVPLKPVRRMKPVQNKPRPKQTKPSVIPLNMLPLEVLEDMKYKPPKRFKPSNASWTTKRLYNFLENKLEPKYDYLARVRAERLVELLYGFTREVKRSKVASDQAVDTLKKEMARLQIVKTHFDFYEFFHEFMPREIRVKVVPDILNKISLPRGGVFSEILQ